MDIQPTHFFRLLVIILFVSACKAQRSNRPRLLTPDYSSQKKIEAIDTSQTCLYFINLLNTAFNTNDKGERYTNYNIDSLMKQYKYCFYKISFYELYNSLSPNLIGYLDSNYNISQHEYKEYYSSQDKGFVLYFPPFYYQKSKKLLLLEYASRKNFFAYSIEDIR